MPIVSVRFTLSLRQDSLLVAEGSTSRNIYCFLSEKWAATQTVRCESESRRGEEIEGHANVGFSAQNARPSRKVHFEDVSRPECGISHGLVERVGLVVRVGVGI